jgi:hypothetical protein
MMLVKISAGGNCQSSQKIKQKLSCHAEILISYFFNPNFEKLQQLHKPEVQDRYREFSIVHNN